MYSFYFPLNYRKLLSQNINTVMQGTYCKWKLVDYRNKDKIKSTSGPIEFYALLDVDNLEAQNCILSVNLSAAAERSIFANSFRILIVANFYIKKS